jgi:molybdenum cofactor cytidylyltransferase
MNRGLPGLSGLVLAAGASRRLGQCKQIVMVDGVPLVRRTVLLIADVCGAPVTVVTGANADRVTACLEGIEVVLVHNPAWHEGLSGSLALGLTALGPGCGAALVAPCDLPGLSAMDLERLAAAWRRTPERPAAACYGGVVGVPAILPEVVFSELLAVTGDRGARDLLRRNDVPVSVVTFPSAAADLDDGGDLATLAGS